MPEKLTSDRPHYRVVVWCAVSSKQQATEDKASLPTQEAEGREFATDIGATVVDVLTVPGHTRDIVLYEDARAAMPAYDRLWQHLEDRDFDVLWALDPDRLGRDPALAQTVASLVERSGAEVYVASAPHVLGQGGSGQRYVYAIQSVRAGEEQRKRTRYHEVGMRRRVERGLPSGKLPYGYRAVRDFAGHMVGVEFSDEIGAVRLATEMYLEGYPYTSIAEALDRSPYRPVIARRWRPRAVWYWMQTPTYAGVATWRDYRTPQPSEAIPALWDARTYRAVQREGERRSRGTYRKRQSSPLLDVAFCARCGGRMVRSTNESGTVWLRCGTHHRRHRTGVSCHANNIRYEEVVAKVLAFLADIVDLDALNASLAEQPDRDAMQARLDELDRMATATEQKRRRLVAAYVAGAMDMAMYRQADDELLADLEALDVEAENVEGELGAHLDPEALLEDVGHVQAMLADGLESVPGIVASTALQNIGLRVEVEDNRIVAMFLA